MSEFSVIEKNGISYVSLGFELSAPFAQPLHTTLLSVLQEKTAGIVLDIDGVGQVSTACLQVIVATAAEAKQQGRAFSLVGISSVMQSGLEVLGFAEEWKQWNAK